jgi:hypothetical protein
VSERTWDHNRTAINQLWPHCQWTDEERRLLTDDLASLDQDVLYDALRNVKREHDTLYPQLRWFRDEYRSLERLRNLRKPSQPSERRQVVDVDKELDERTGSELRLVVEDATVENYREVVSLVCDKAAALQIRMQTAFALNKYLYERLGLNDGGRVS